MEKTYLATLKPSPAPKPAMRHARIETRAPITMWGLLVWAYKQELVRFAGRDGASLLDHSGYSGTASVCDALGAGIVGGRGEQRGTINGRPSAHPDADWVHAEVSRLPAEESWPLIRAAEAGRPPEWAPELPTAKVVRVWSKGGKPRMLIDPVSRRPVACLIAIEGVAEHEREQRLALARLAWVDFVILLRRLRDALVERDRLERWQISGIGLELEPWASDAANGC